MDPSITADLEAPKDPGALRGHADVTDNEILGKIFFRVFPNKYKNPLYYLLFFKHVLKNFPAFLTEKQNMTYEKMKDYFL